MANTPIRVLQYGLGPIGQESARTLLEKAETGRVALVGAVDIDPAKFGRPLADVLEDDRATGFVYPTLAEALAAVDVDVAVHTTRSFLPDVESQLNELIDAGLHVVSSTEELSYPYRRHPELARRLDERAAAGGVAILGTGVNPGFAMDTLALLATAPCTRVSRLDIHRVVDASHRRKPLQMKIGAGLTEAAFADKKAAGGFGHIGLVESLLLVAEGLGWQLEQVEERLEPMIAPREVTTPFVTVEPGQVAGIHHAVRGFAGGETLLSLTLQMYVGADDPRDAVKVHGKPPIDLVVQGGIFGDTGTIGLLVNAVPLIGAARPGLRTMLDLPVPRAFATAAARATASP